jgi:serine/threonine protein kinase
VPSVDLGGDAEYLKRFVIEEWVLRRVKNPHLLRSAGKPGRRSHLYIAMEYVEGQRLGQWMRDNPRPDIETVRDMLEQIGKGVQSLHRMEMLHQDLHPDNIIIDRAGTLKIIDFGSVSVAGLTEGSHNERSELLGQLQYTAPECLLGEPSTQRSDLFSLGVITYQMLTARLPYDAQAAAIKTWSDVRRLNYRPAARDDISIPAWVDLAIRRAVHPDPAKRYEELSEFLYDLRNPRASYLQRKTPLIERNPLLFWPGLALVLLLTVIGLLVKIAVH